MIVITTMKTLPEYCFDCPCNNGEYGECQADEQHRSVYYRPYWCPLKDIPNEQEVGEANG